MDQFSAEFLKRRCEGMKKCGLFSADMNCDDPTRSTEDTARFYRHGLARGDVRYDGVTAARCLADLAAGEGCTPGKFFSMRQDAPLSCLQVFVGDGVEGAPCGACAPGFVCTELIGSAACGTCVPAVALMPLREGEACERSFGAPCESGLYCDSVCTPFRAVGESCGPSLECSPGARCSDEGLCIQLLPKGATCVALGTCGDSMQCIDGVCAERAVNGAPCASMYDCRSASCRDGICAPLGKEGALRRSKILLRHGPRLSVQHPDVSARSRTWSRMPDVLLRRRVCRTSLRRRDAQVSVGDRVRAT